MTDCVYYTSFLYNDWNIFIAATKKGLCYISTCPNKESENYLRKTYGNIRLEENKNSMKVYEDQLIEYINGERKAFDFSLSPKGTAFQKSVWDALIQIPYGKTFTYSKVAEIIGKPSAVRAVANAIGKNPILIVIPCHRVIRKNGELSGFREGVQVKEKLLKMEGGLSIS
ncbi:methylated-DNA--[protein]-cysteine S-methyltransferase [Pseudogracilibacillus sp. SO30301A]|uniref:methylated-DNA--[protein]-cysteine S-methyltransferase n=1 Tax=Pseudogracilibacillus sp. SO30301A TaxID=3098291 RepID=UPI00300DF9F6